MNLLYTHTSKCSIAALAAVVKAVYVRVWVV